MSELFSSFLAVPACYDFFSCAVVEAQSMVTEHMVLCEALRWAPSTTITTPHINNDSDDNDGIQQQATEGQTKKQ
jgi:hypothetical protein